MKYLKLHPINENMNWLLSKKDDIIECSYDITDMPYDFLHCGRVPSDSDISYYLSYEGKSYVINWVGEVDLDLINEGEVLNTSVSGDYKDKIKVSNWSDNGKVNDFVEGMLPNIESTIGHLKSNVFNDREYDVTFNILFYEKDLWSDDEVLSALRVGMGIRVNFRLV
jgi:hypothetical protein